MDDKYRFGTDCQALKELLNEIRYPQTSPPKKLQVSFVGTISETKMANLLLCYQ